MIIPFSILIILAGLVSIPYGAGGRGVLLVAVGVVELLLSSKSLSNFQARKSSTPFTAGSTGPPRFDFDRSWSLETFVLNLCLADLSSAA